ncbi:GntR family transcriptional regulator [Streptomyces sp. DH-12]|uniref:MocR-like pyridoxine biosynthesis transcription factor PdxR n=1 Tax=Streptomyces sp. DH-12 TaxID=2072509 RepID=UPI000CCE3F02|nr:PLP-dependent aminotransferase family protein [Streptomyces sp. DH-12]PNV33088.1 GntR family transcriptional regulator [Streptomyces sp. DH-12]
MAERWATFGIDLHLDPRGPGLRRGLTDALREAVRGGRLAPGARLPSSRSLAADLGVARNTVADAYADLVAEGWLTARQGSGTRVADRAAPGRPAAAPTPRRTPGRLPYSLMPGTPDLASFPRAAWLRATRRALAAAPHDAFGYGDPRGRPELREALAGYLSRVRGVRADPEHVVVCSGFAHGLRLLCEVLRARGARTLAVESYGLDAHWDLVRRAGLETVPLARDDLGTRAGDPGDADAVLLNPAHQFPLGGALRPERRAAVVEWARRTGGLILEDDYDGEFRYDRQPVGALQDLDPGRVVYLGTASKSLAPGLRLGWMVVPPWLLPDVLAHGGGRTVSVVEQLVLAEFLSSGAHDRQVRAARLRYRRRRDALVRALAERAPHVRVTGIAAGLHAVLELPPGTEQAVQRAAVWQGLAVKGLDFFRHPGVTAPAGDALVVGYATPPDHAWNGTLEALLRALP